jgi:hypothetical protein
MTDSRKGLTVQRMKGFRTLIRRCARVVICGVGTRSNVPPCSTQELCVTSSTGWWHVHHPDFTAGTYTANVAQSRARGIAQTLRNVALAAILLLTACNRDNHTRACMDSCGISPAQCQQCYPGD